MFSENAMDTSIKRDDLISLQKKDIDTAITKQTRSLYSVFIESYGRFRVRKF